MEAANVVVLEHAKFPDDPYRLWPRGPLADASPSTTSTRGR